MVTQEMLGEIERQRLTLRLRREDDLDFYRELYTILKEIPTEIWERLGFKNVKEIRIHPDLTNPMKDVFSMHLEVWIYYDHIYKAELSGFERVDSPWADLAQYWKPYRDFLMKEMRTAMHRMEGFKEDKEEGRSITDAEIQAKLDVIPLVNADCEENQLRHYIDGLNLYPIIVKECQQQYAVQMRDLRRITVDVSLAEIIRRVEGEDTDPLIIQLRKYCDYIRRWEGDDTREMLIRFLLSSSQSIEELNHDADELVTKVRDGAVSEIPGFQYLFDQLGMAGIIRRDTLCLKNMKRRGLEEFLIDYIYREVLLTDIEIALRIIIYKTENGDEQGLIQKVLFPYGSIMENEELWSRLQNAAEIYKDHEKRPLSDYEVIVEKQEDDYRARIPLFDAQEKGKTEEEAIDRLQKKFEKDHEKWISAYAVKSVFGSEPSGNAGVTEKRCRSGR